jgi:hypothetical protein
MKHEFRRHGEVTRFLHAAALSSRMAERVKLSAVELSGFCLFFG